MNLNERDQSKPRVPRYWLGSLSLLLTAFIVSVLVYWGLDSDPSAFLAALCVFLIPAIPWLGWLLWITARGTKAREHTNCFGALGISLLMISTVVSICIPALHRSGCGTWRLPIYSWFTASSWKLTEWLSEHGKMPPRLDALLGPELARLIASDQIFGEPEDYLLGSLTLEDALYLEGTLDEREWRDNAESLPPAQGAWERLGPALISREIPAWRSEHEDVIVLGVLGMRRCLLFGGSHLPKAIASFETAGGSSVADIDLDDRWGRDRFERLISADRAARDLLGLSQPPDYASMIREYVESQKAR